MILEKLVIFTVKYGPPDVSEIFAVFHKTETFYYCGSMKTFSRNKCAQVLGGGISGSHGGENKDDRFLGYCAV